MGSTTASKHPVSFKLVQETVDKRGARIICFDPRYTQSASKSNLYTPLRSDIDIAFLGGIVKYILAKNLSHHDYVFNYTNASFLVNSDLKLLGDNNGVFPSLAKGK
jgi:formate dehydrogenase major subunit